MQENGTGSGGGREKEEAWPGTWQCGVRGQIKTRSPEAEIRPSDRKVQEKQERNKT